MRAIAIRYLESSGTLTVDRTKEIQAQDRAGFIWMKSLLELLDGYEQERTRYRTFAEFMPQLVRYFNAVAHGAIS